MILPKRPKKKLKGKKAPVAEPPKADTPKAAEPTPAIPEVENREERNIAMFKEWLMGKTHEQLAQDYKLSRVQVSLIASKYNWKGLRKQLRDRQFSATIDRLRDLTVLIQDALEADIRKIIEEAVRAKRTLTKEERDHMRAMYDRVLKEIRLDDGKPTEINTGGVTRVEVVLPPGAKRFGLIPPDPKVTITESKPEDKPTIDIDSIEEDVKGKLK